MIRPILVLFFGAEINMIHIHSYSRPVATAPLSGGSISSYCSSSPYKLNITAPRPQRDYSPHSVIATFNLFLTDLKSPPSVFPHKQRNPTIVFQHYKVGVVAENLQGYIHQLEDWLTLNRIEVSVQRSPDRRVLARTGNHPEEHSHTGKPKLQRSWE